MPAIAVHHTFIFFFLFFIFFYLFLFDLTINYPKISFDTHMMNAQPTTTTTNNTDVVKRAIGGGVIGLLVSLAAVKMLRPRTQLQHTKDEHNQTQAKWDAEEYESNKRLLKIELKKNSRLAGREHRIARTHECLF